MARELIDPIGRERVIDRSLALGAQAFGALIPLLIVLQAVQPGSRSIDDEIVDRFALTGIAATSVHRAFSVTTGSPQTVTVLGFALLLISALSFTRRLQRLYAETWGSSRSGCAGRPGGCSGSGCWRCGRSCTRWSRACCTGTPG